VEAGGEPVIVAPVAGLQEAAEEIMNIEIFGILLDRLVQHSRADGVGNEELAAMLQDAVDALREGAHLTSASEARTAGVLSDVGYGP
jgi:hypothetical protein